MPPSHMICTCSMLALVACHESSPQIVGADTSTDSRVDPTVDPTVDARPDDEAPPPCFAACARTYFSSTAGCIDTRHDCLMECDGFRDFHCLETCEDDFYGCTDRLDMEMERCMEDCPCWPEFTACVDGCDYPGDECWVSCEDEFRACSGEDISGLGACVESCAYMTSDCGFTCEHISGYEEWVACTTECELAFTDCMSGCFLP